jgi:uncharacterized protein (TIGR02646 family)
LKKLIPPTVPRDRVKNLCKKMLNQEVATSLWGRTSGYAGDFKALVTSELRVNQGRRCAYCGSYLFEEYPHRDHVAPKSPYFQWTFWPANIVLACYACNTDRKKTTDTVSIRRASYRRSEFSIIHPYFDEPSDHLNFIGHRGGILINPKNGSPKGRETIRLFDLMSPERAKQRAKDNLFDSDASHLHGRFRYLLEQLVFAPLPAARALKMKR